MKYEEFMEETNAAVRKTVRDKWRTTEKEPAMTLAVALASEVIHITLLTRMGHKLGLPLKARHWYLLYCAFGRMTTAAQMLMESNRPRVGFRPPASGTADTANRVADLLVDAMRRGATPTTPKPDAANDEARRERMAKLKARMAAAAQEDQAAAARRAKAAEEGG